jgi:hypothetical protein
LKYKIASHAAVKQVELNPSIHWCPSNNEEHICLNVSRQKVEFIHDIPLKQQELEMNANSEHGRRSYRRKCCCRKRSRKRCAKGAENDEADADENADGNAVGNAIGNAVENAVENDERDAVGNAVANAVEKGAETRRDMTRFENENRGCSSVDVGFGGLS